MDMMGRDMTSRKPPPKVVSREIDENIRKIYQEVVEEELPDRFKDLLAKLRGQESGDGKN